MITNVLPPFLWFTVYIGRAQVMHVGIVGPFVMWFMFLVGQFIMSYGLKCLASSDFK